MKKVNTLIFAFLGCIVGGFSACDIMGDEDFSSLNDRHQWVQEVVKGTCTQDEVVYRYCAEENCGAGWSTSITEKAKGHQLDDNQTCTVCRQSLQSTEGLLYELREPTLYEDFAPYAIVTGYEGAEKEVSIGYTPKGLPVKEIGKEAFQNSEITSVTVCDIVTEIKTYAFKGCASLTEIRLSDSVKRIEQGAFENCISLTEIEIPKNVYEMSMVFDGCASLTNIAVAEGNMDFKSIDGNLYHYDSRPYHKDKKFSILQYARGKKESSFMIPDGVTSLSWNTFKDCDSLKKITLPNSLEWIGNGVFHGCTGLTEIIIPDGVRVIQSGAFHGCTGLTSVEIPASVTEIQWKIFPACTNLKEIKVAEENLVYISIDGDLYCKKDDGYYKTNTLVEYAFGKTEDSFALPFGTRIIGNYAFDSVSNLKTVIIPEGVEEIEMFAFYDCDNIEKIYLPKSLTKVGDCVFKCINLKQVIYNGTKAEWEAIGNHASWLWVETSVEVVCTDGSIFYTADIVEGNDEK